MIRRMAVVALLSAAPCHAQICRGHRSFEKHRARAMVQFVGSNKTGTSTDIVMGLAYGLSRNVFVSGDYVADHPPFGGGDDAIAHTGGEGLAGVQIADDRMGTFAVCPLLGYGFSNADGTTLLGTSDVQTRSSIVGLALGAAPPVGPDVRLLPSIEFQFRSDRSEGTTTFSGATTSIDSRDQYLVTTIGLGLAFDRFTVTPLYRRRLDERWTGWGLRVSFNFGPSID